MKGRTLSLSVKVNLLIAATVLAVSSVLLAISANNFWNTVYEPHVRKLNQLSVQEEELIPILSRISRLFGTEVMDEFRRHAESGEILSVSEYSGEIQQMLNDLVDVSLVFIPIEEKYELDEIYVEIRKGGTVYQVMAKIRTESSHEEEFNAFGREEAYFPGLAPEECPSAVLHEDQGVRKLVRCIPFEVDGGEGRVWFAYNMTDFFANYRSFMRRSILLILLMTVLASAAGMLLMRRLVTRRVRNLAKAARDFAPGEDGRYSMESVSRAETESGDEIGDLGRDIRSMQERIIGNTESLALMTAERERISTELDLATRIQASVLPKDFPAFPEREEFSLYASMTPAKEVGGDFYDFFLVDEDHLALVIADVSGKGIPAALFMMVAKSLIKNQLRSGCSPAQAMEQVNRQLCEGNSSMMFVTVWAAVLELSTGRGSACNAGHEKPALRRAEGRFELLKYKHDILAGINPGAKYHPREFELRPGDCLFVYTDGVTEADDTEQAMFGEGRLENALNEDAGADPEALVSRMHEALKRFAGSAPQFDDITMLCLEYRGPQKPAAGRETPAEEHGEDNKSEERQNDDH